MSESKLNPEQKKIQVRSCPMTIVIGFLSLGAFWYAVITRTLDDFTRYPIFIAGTLGALIALAALPLWIREGAKRPSLKVALTILVAAPIVLYFAGVIYYGWGTAIRDLYLHLQGPTSDRQFKVFITMLVTASLGVLLFLFRLKLRAVYGLTESMVGVAVAVHRVTTEAPVGVPTDPAFYLAILTAGVYLVVRGLDNLHQGLTKEPYDPVATHLIRRSRSTKLTIEMERKGPDAA